ncbi:MAG TPA: lysylphosphatidylglycerol synthase transmembrane domain-containing protein [Lentimicrobium sp.]|nr:lysylphosphatidylglycerol synthase transmembrane domain-containing protein [Lentimicrobium sp.]
MKSYLKAFLKIVLSAAALYYVFTKIDIRQVVDILQHVNYLYLLVALLFFTLSKLVSARRLNYYFEAAGITLENTGNLKLYLLGMYYNLFLPGGIGGDGYKIWLLNKKFNIRVKDLFWGVMLDRVNGVLALFLLALILVPFLDIDTQWNLYALALIPVSLFTYYFVNKKFFPLFYKVIKPTTLLSFAVQALQVVSAFFILLANNSTQNLFAYIFVFLISSMIAVLPITIGGIGSREITFLFGSQLLNLDVNLSIALSLLFYLITVLVSFGGIFYSFKPEAMNLRATIRKETHQTY